MSRQKWNLNIFGSQRHLDYFGIMLCLWLLGSAVGCTDKYMKDVEKVRLYEEEGQVEMELLSAYPKDVLAWNDDEKSRQRDAAKSLLLDLYLALQRKDETFQIPPGNYRFDTTLGYEFSLYDFSDMTIDGTGATFWFDPKYGIKLNQCTNLVLSGIVIDYDPLPFMQAKVVAVDYRRQTVDIEFDPAYPLPGGLDTSAGAASLINLGVRFFDSKGRWLHLQWDTMQSVKHLGGYSYRILSFANNRVFRTADYEGMLEPGDWIVFLQRTASACVLENCEFVMLEDITVYASPNMVFMETGGTGGNVYRRCSLVRRPETNRLMTSGRDVFHSYLMEKGPLIEECEFSYSGDDIIAIHGFFSLVLEQRSPTELILVTPFPRDFDIGSTLNFYSHLDARPFGSAGVKSWVKVKDPSIIAAVSRLPEELGAKGIKTRTLSSDSEVLLVQLDAPVDVSIPAVAECRDLSGQGAIIRNNYLHDSQSRAITVRSHDLVIENNRIERVGPSAIIIQPDGYWLESIFASNVTIRGNRITDCGWLSFNQHYLDPCLGAIQVGDWFGERLFPMIVHPYQQNHSIAIFDNTITRAASISILLINIRDSKVQGNVIEAPFSKQIGLAGLDLKQTIKSTTDVERDALERAKNPYYAIFLMSADNVLLQDNRVVDPPSVLKGIVGVGPWTSNIQIKESDQ